MIIFFKDLADKKKKSIKKKQKTPKDEKLKLICFERWKYFFYQELKINFLIKFIINLIKNVIKKSN